MCVGALTKKSDKVWEVLPEQDIKYAMWIDDDPNGAMRLNNRTLVEWRLRKFIKDEAVSVVIGGHPFQNLFRHYQFNLPLKSGEELRKGFMKAIRDMVEKKQDSAVQSMVFYFKDRPYLKGMVEAAVSGADSYHHDEEFERNLAIYDSQPDPADA